MPPCYFLGVNHYDGFAMKNSFAKSFVVCALAGVLGVAFIACGDDSSTSPGNLSFVNEEGDVVSIEIKSGSFKDSRDGASYSTVSIDGITWMTENLRYIEEGKSGMETSKEAGASKDYGVLYSFDKALSICPVGFHLPTAAEWRNLFQTMEKVYGDSSAWALKSKSGWLPDDDMDGNGGDVIGFSVEATGIKNGGYRGEGEHSAFWMYGKKDKDGYATGVRFDNDDVDYTFAEFYASRARLYVRCVSDENTLFEILGKCDSTAEGNVVGKNGDYMTCKDSLWVSSTHKEILNYELGTCDSALIDSVRTFNDTAYTCKVSVSFGVSTGSWNVSTKGEALGKCTQENAKEFKKFQGTEYVCHEIGGSLYSWRIPTAEDVLEECNEKIQYKVETFNDTAYICKKFYSKFEWLYASEEEVIKNSLPECTESKKGTVEKTKVGGFVCIDKYWRRLNIVEENLGICQKAGATGKFDGFTFTCDEKYMLWKATLSGDTALVAVDSVLWMTENVYDGKYVYSPLAKGSTSCPAGFTIPTEETWKSLSETLRKNGQIHELFANQDSSYYGLNLYEKEATEHNLYLLEYFNIVASSKNYKQAPAMEISPQYQDVVSGSVWVCSSSESNDWAGVCSSGYAHIRCVKEYGTSEESK